MSLCDSHRCWWCCNIVAFGAQTWSTEAEDYSSSARVLRKRFTKPVAHGEFLIRALLCWRAYEFTLITLFCLCLRCVN